jgi:MFS family permease
MAAVAMDADPVTPVRARGPALAAMCLGFFMVLLDGSALNIALPSVGRDLHGSIAALPWVVNIYTIPLASVLLTAGNLGDRLGARRLFAWSLGLFTLASLLCAVSPGLGVLVAARAVQGVAAGGMLPTTLAVITGTYTEPAERARAITVWGGVGGLALVAGPLGGGLLTSVFGWRSIFLGNVPFGLATLALTVRYVREAPRRPGGALDVPGQIAGTVALGALAAGLIGGGAGRWPAPATFGLLALAVAAAVTFVAVERLSRHPMLPLAMFRRGAFTASVAGGFAFQFGGYGAQFALAIFVQEQWRVGPARAGLLFLPFSVSWVFGTIVLNRSMVHRGPRWLLRTGGVTGLAGALLVVPVVGAGSWPLFETGTALAGLGCGLLAPSLSAAAMQSVDPKYYGLGSGVLNASRQAGMTVGIAALGGLIALPDMTLGMRLCMALAAACFLVIAVLAGPAGRARPSLPR